MKKLSYHVNPVIRKREEELHLKNMENKIRAAKSTLPGAQNKAQPGQPGTKRQDSGRAASRGRRTPPVDAEHGAAAPHDIQMIDDLIHARLEDILGQPLIQRIQSMVRGVGSHSSPVDSTKGMARAQSSRPAAKPPRTGKRAPWNEEWTSPGAPSSSTRPGDAGGSPVSHTPPRVVRAQSLGHTPGSPYSARAQSASPGSRMHRPSAGDASHADYGQDRDPYAAQAQAMPSAAASPPPRVHLLSVPTSSPSSPRPPPSSRYNAASASGAAQGASVGVLTHSDAAVIATLNPEVAHLRQPPTHGLGGRPPSAGSYAGTPRSATSGPRVVSDATMMSLSHLSLANSPGGGGRAQGAGGRLSQGLRRSQLSSATAALQPRQQDAPAAAADDEEEYEDDFELVDEEELRAQDDEANHTKVDMSKLRQSVAMLNSLVQMKIRALAEDEESCQARGVWQEEGGQDQESGFPSDPAECAPEAEHGHGEAQQDEELLGAEWADEDSALLQSQALMGGSAEFGQSSMLLPVDLDGGLLLQQSDLDYLERLGGGGHGAGGQAEEWGQSQDDVPVQLEAPGPVGDTAAWGDKRLPPMRRSPAATARLQRLKEERQQAAEAVGAAGAAEPSAVTASQSGLAQEATALFSSLRKLHELMSGPRAVDLSPRQEDGMTSNFPRSPKQEGASRGTERHDISVLDVPVNATLWPVVVDTDSSRSAGQDAADGLQGQLTPKNHLCAADVEWMASLMHTLSASLQGTDLEDWLSHA